jgi:D-serine deaminase-like pyridoxal phosphate-dependent protein
MHYRELPTPALTIDLGILERNLDRMANYCRDHSLRLRPHIKTHKMPEVARLQLDRGAVGLTVAKVGEAEVMAGAEFDDILIAYPVFGLENLRRLARLAHHRKLFISLDDEATAQALSSAAVERSETIGVLVELDVGFGRCGLQTGEACVALARKVEKLPGLAFRGLMTYFGNVWGTTEERSSQIKLVAGRLERGLEAFRQAQLPVEIVSGGSTPSAEFAHKIPSLTEIRPGTYVCNDLNTMYQGVCQLDDCAARVVTTVVSTAVPGRAIIDAGSKTLSSEPLRAGPQTGYGHVVEAPDAQLVKLNEEHGHLDITRSTHPFKVGDVLTVVPNHVCTCVNMHDDVFVLRNQEVVACWRVAARGKVR